MQNSLSVYKYDSTIYIHRTARLKINGDLHVLYIYILRNKHAPGKPSIYHIFSSSISLLTASIRKNFSGVTIYSNTITVQSCFDDVHTFINNHHELLVDAMYKSVLENGEVSGAK